MQGAYIVRVVIIALHFAEYSLSLAKAIAEQNDVLLILSEPNFNNEVGAIGLTTIPKRLKVELLPHYTSLGLLLNNIWKLRAYVRGFLPDVIHLQEEPKDYLIGALPFFGRIPIVLTVHDPKPHIGLDAKRIRFSRRAFYIKLLRLSSNSIIVHGEYLKKIAQQCIPQRRDKVFSVAHGPLGKIFERNVDYEWKSGYCLFFGRIEAYKGLGVFIEALRILKDQGITVKGVIAGRGSELEKYQDALRDTELFDVRNRYLSVEEVLSCFQEANIVVLPYLEATQSGVSAYAIGMGRPVVATEVGGLPESVRHNVTGLLVPAGDPLALANSLKLLLSDTKLAQKMAINSWGWGQNELSWHNLAIQTIAVYKQTKLLNS